MWETVGIRGIPNERIRNDSRIIIGAIYWLFKCFEFLRKPSIPTLPCVVSGDPRSSSSLIMSGRKLWSVAFAPQPSYPTTSPQETLIGTITFAVFASTAFISLLVYAAFLKFRCRVSRRHNAPVVIADAVAAEEERARGQALTRLLREMPVRVLRHEEDASDVLLVDGCSICLGKYEAGERVRVLPRCSHAYHKDCVDPWLILHAEHSCPLCRTLLPMSSPIELVNYMHESHEQFEISL